MVSSFIPHQDPAGGGCCHHPHYIDGETEDQKIDSYSKIWKTAEFGFRHRLADPRTWPLNPHAVLFTIRKQALAKRIEVDFLFPSQKLVLALIGVVSMEEQSQIVPSKTQGQKGSFPQYIFLNLLN